MRRRWRWYVGALLVVVVVCLLLLPAFHWHLIGWCKGEAFFQGRPTSYWRQRIETETEFYTWTTPPPSVVDDVRGAITGRYSNWVLGDLREHPASIPVLVEILLSEPAEALRQRAGTALLLVVADWADSLVTRTFVPALVRGMDTEDEKVRGILLGALQVIDPAEAARFLPFEAQPRR